MWLLNLTGVPLADEEHPPNGGGPLADEEYMTFWKIADKNPSLGKTNWSNQLILGDLPVLPFKVEIGHDS